METRTFAAASLDGGWPKAVRLLSGARREDRTHIYQSSLRQKPIVSGQPAAAVFIDRQGFQLILNGVIRHLLALLCAIGLAVSPLAVVPASAAQMSDCTMGGDMPDMPADHSKMDCCTPACHVPSASALLPRLDADVADAPAPQQLLGSAPVKQLESILASGLDPPPRS